MATRWLSTLLDSGKMKHNALISLLIFSVSFAPVALADTTSQEIPNAKTKPEKKKRSAVVLQDNAANAGINNTLAAAQPYTYSTGAAAATSHASGSFLLSTLGLIGIGVTTFVILGAASGGKTSSGTTGTTVNFVK